MNWHKTLLMVSVAAVMCASAAWLLFSGPKETAKPADNLSAGMLPAADTIAVPLPTSSPNPVNSGPKIEVTIEITHAGFSPPFIPIPSGTTVKFVNSDTVPHWPASDPHPAHTECPGFDALRPVPPGGSYVFTFNDVKTCHYHDHLNPAVKGVIMVQ